MKRIAATLVTCLMLLAAVSQAALASELSEFSVETGGTMTTGNYELGLTGANIRCTSGSGEFKAISKKLALEIFEHKGCTLGGKSCHSLGAAPGAIFLLTEIHILWFIQWLLHPQVHIECEFLKELIRVQGNVLGTITKTGAKTFKVIERSTEGKQELTEFENDTGEKMEAHLEGAINTGAFKAATLNSESVLSTSLETEIL